MHSSHIRTFTGKLVDPLNLKPEDIDILDIGHHLSNICRFTGACRFFYSVGYHSILVSMHCRPENALHGLLHDAAEAYLTDLSAPLKHSVQFEFFRQLEYDAENVIWTKYGLSTKLPFDVKEADERAYVTEVRDIMPQIDNDWYRGREPYADRIVKCTPEAVERAFLTRFHYLYSARNCQPDASSRTVNK